MGRYSQAPDVQKIADKLIEDTHSHLRGETVRCIYRDKHSISKGKVQLVKAHKIGGLAGWLHLGFRSKDEDKFTDLFVLEVAKDIWERLDAAQRVALVDHGLCHFDVEIPDQGDKDRRLLIRGKDVEEFTAVVERHGMWRTSIEEFIKVGNQLTIDDQAQPIADDPTDEDQAPRLRAVDGNGTDG